MLEQKEICAVLKNNLYLLEGLEFTHPSSARTKGDIYVPGTYTNIFVLIFRFMRYADVCFFALSEYVQHFRIPGTCYVPDAYDTRYVLYRYLFIRAWVVVRLRAWVVVRIPRWLGTP